MMNCDNTAECKSVILNLDCRILLDKYVNYDLLKDGVKGN